MVILLAFANDQQGSLTQLKSEAKNIRTEFRYLEKANFVKFISINDATNEDISEYFQGFYGEIRIFHFGGHANGSQLILDDQPSNSLGLAKLISVQKNLQLVFLNGCSTRGHVKKLLHLGVKVVIATNAPIGDDSAVKFSKAFYKCLASHHTISEAFQSAVGSLEMTFNNNLEIRRYEVDIHNSRSLFWEEKIEKNPWGLFVNKDYRSAQDWRIPLIESPWKDEKPKLSMHIKMLFETLQNDAASNIDNELYNRLGDEEQIEIQLTKITGQNHLYNVNQFERFLREKKRLMIVGGAGAGKTTTILQIAKKIIDDSKEREYSLLPIPFRVNLSSWTVKRKRIVNWLIEQLSLPENSSLTNKNAKKLFEKQLVFPILDGLDQVYPGMQLSCIQAINEFVKENPSINIVVVCRIQTYKKYEKELNFLRDVFEINSLTREQVFGYVNLKYNTGTLPFPENEQSKEEVLSFLEKRRGFEGGLSPFMLKVIVEVFDQLTQELKKGDYEKEEYDRMILQKSLENSLNKQEREEGKYKGNPQSLVFVWLSWLAGRIKKRHSNSEIFSSDDIQPSWLPHENSNWIWGYVITSRVLQTYVLLFCFSIKMIAVFLYEFVFFGLIAGVLIGIVDWIRLTRKGANKVVNFLLNEANILTIFLVCALILPILFGLSRDAPAEDLVFGVFSLNGINIGFLCSLLLGGIFGLRGRIQTLRSDSWVRSNSEIDLRAALKGAKDYFLLFSAILSIIALTVYFFGGSSTNGWMSKAIDQYVGPYLELVGMQSEVLKTIGLAVFLDFFSDLLLALL